MNGTMGLRDRLCTLFEDGLAWFVESGALGAIPILALLAMILSHLK